MDQMLKVYEKDLMILRMERRGLIKQLNKNEKAIIQTEEYCNQIKEGELIWKA